MASRFNAFTCIWLDASVDSNAENKIVQDELRQIINQVVTCDNVEAGEKRIRKNSTESIILIVSGTFGREIIPKIHDLSHLVAFYVYCQDRKRNEQWANQYPKISGVVTTGAKLLERISEDQRLREKTDNEPIFSIISLNSLKLEARNATSMWFQLFIEVLIHMRHKTTERKQMISLCREMAASNAEDLKILDEFEKTYTSEKAIWWYTRDTCLHKIMNKALRAQEFDTVFAFGFFITDIAKQIQLGYEDFIRKDGCRNTFQVYRGQMIHRWELELMKNNINGFLSMNSFLSTSREKKIAMRFLQPESRENQVLPVLLEIEIDPKLRTKAFFDVRKSSEYKGEYEILIMLGALFCIKKVFEHSHKKLWIVQTSLANEDDSDLKDIFAHMKEKIGDETDIDTLGKLLIRMDENERARKCYQRMMQETQLTLSDAQMGLGWASLRCQKTEEGIKYFQESLEIRKRLLGDDHPRVAEVHSFLGEGYRKAENYDEALIHLNKAMDIEERVSQGYSSNLAVTYETIGSIYTTIENYDLALSYYEKVLCIRKAILPADHPQMAAAYTHLGWLYDEQGNNSEAMEHYQKALEIAKRTLPPTHRMVIQAKENIRKLKMKMND